MLIALTPDRENELVSSLDRGFLIALIANA